MTRCTNGTDGLVGICGEASACYLPQPTIPAEGVLKKRYCHPSTHTFLLAHMPVKRYLSRYPATVAASLIVHHGISLVGCRSLHACSTGANADLFRLVDLPPTRCLLIIALFAPLDSPRFFGLPSTLSPTRASITTSACFTLLTSPCLAACDYQTLFDCSLRRASGHYTLINYLPSITHSACVFASIKTSLIRPSARRASSQPALAALQTESSRPFSALSSLHFLSAAL
jgi:hypothetical protein